MSNKNGLTPAFFCVPDITGFTKFIATSDINYTREVIPALLRKLIESNILGLNIGEIEGDAIFFYRTGRLPSIAKVADQCRHIYTVFKEFIACQAEEDPENFKKFLANDQLGLKIIIHCGKISVANIKGRTKLLGEDVIITHKLLKNDIPDYNYILLTDKYLTKIKNKKNLDYWFHWEELKSGKVDYEYLGEVGYAYIPFE